MRDSLSATVAAILAYARAGWDACIDRLVAISIFSDRKHAERSAQRFARDTRAQGRTNMVGLFIGLLIAAIVAIDVFIPVILDAVSNSNASGNTLTILNLLPLFAALLLLVALAAPLMRRV